ncbi:MAG: hypothetical protein AB7I98_19885 [Verrucomicrobiales bacterium]
MVSAESQSAGNLELLKQLMLGDEQRAIRLLQERIEGLEADSAARLARDLCEALRLRRAAGESGFEELVAALQPGTEAAIHRSVSEDKSRLSKALYPIMGPAIRSYVTGLFRDLAADLNETIRNTTSLERLRWRVQAKLTGKPFSEYLLLKTRAYEIEEIYWMERDSGLLLGHVERPRGGQTSETAIDDSDLISGMFSAIRSFVRDSFGRHGDSAGGGGELREFSFGDREVLIEDGPGTVLAAVSRGVPPNQVRELLKDILEELHSRHQKALAHFDGDPETLLPARPVLEKALLANHPGQAQGGGMWRVWLLLGLIGAGLVAWAVWAQWESSKWNQFVRALEAEPGIEVLEARKGGWFHGAKVIGLRDPLATDPAQFAREHGQNEVLLQLTPYHSLEDRFVARRGADQERQWEQRREALLATISQDLGQVREGTITTLTNRVSDFQAGQERLLAEMKEQQRAELRSLAVELVRSRFGHLPNLVLEFLPQGGMKLTGEAYEPEFSDVVAQLQALPSLGPLDSSGFVNATTVLLADLRARSGPRQVAFMDGQTSITEEAVQRMSEFSSFARTYQADADKVGRRVRFIIHSYPLIGKNREANRIVEQQRAILVRERLTALGLDGGLIGIHPEEDLTKAGSGVTVMPELVPAP